MKKRLLTIFICFLCFVAFFSGCGLGSYIDHNKDKGQQSTITPGGPNNPNPGNPGKPDDPDNPPVGKKNYTVTVYYKNKIFNPGNLNVTVVWRNSQSIIRVALGADGKADAGELEGDYNVYLEGLPSNSNYTYDPSGYVATEAEPFVAILLTDIQEPQRGNGLGLYENEGCYTANKEGTYRAQIEYEGQFRYYQYTLSPGWYKIESWVNAYEDNVDPYVVRYSGTTGFKQVDKTIESGGFQLAGGFTKNFRDDIQIANQGQTVTYAVTAVSKFSEYPLYVDFAIVYLGDYKDSYSDVRTIRAQRARGTAKDPGSDEHFEWADMGTKVFDMDNYKFNENTGYYHRYSMELYGDNPLGHGKGFGPILYCSIKNSLPSYTFLPSLYNAHNVQTEMGPVNFLLIYNVWLEDEKKYVTYDYQEFIRSTRDPIGYGATCNKDGYCYVTQELKDFLQAFAEGYELWSDGVKERAGFTGTPESNGYVAKQDALWLFACGFYEKSEDKNEQENS
ncbi:MAG: hypothetical protein J1G07_03685 [Clostridiales bacterium]|nr:hypothetical protein [Clostridiales bacterium]